MTGIQPVSSSCNARFVDGVVFQHLVAGPVMISTLAEKLGVAQHAASNLVADLQGRGYVSRRPDPADARACIVVLTDRGQAVIAAAPHAPSGNRRRATQALGEDQVENARCSWWT